MFESKNIKLRKLAADDYTLYHSWRNDVEVMQATSPYLDLYTIEDTQQFIALISSQSSAKGYLIEHKESERTVGIISLVNIDYKNRSAECIIDIGEKDIWGKGIGREAMGIILEFAFNEMNLHRLYLQVFSFNRRAVNLYEKLGFTLAGKFREALYRQGEWHDIILMDMLEDEYRSENSVRNSVQDPQ